MMSTKWNNNQRLQKTPKVCKIPTAAAALNLAAFADYPLQAFASWKNPSSPLEAFITGSAVLEPIPMSNLHFGRIQGSTHALELDLIYIPLTRIFNYTVSLMLGAAVLTVRMVQFDDEHPKLPFVAGLFTWEHDGTSDVVHSKIYS